MLVNMRQPSKSGDRQLSEAMQEHKLSWGLCTKMVGVPQNDAQAVKWYQLAAEQGYAFAQYNLGGMYKNGRGVPQDYTEAVRLYRLSAEQGHALEQTNLGVLYVSGFGVQQDKVLAHMWFNLGAANGNEFGAENRESIAREMTSQEIEKAQALARTCMANEYKNCGY